MSRCPKHNWYRTMGLDYNLRYILRCANCGKERSQTKGEFMANVHILLHRQEAPYE